jgi:hypothetical protein
VIESSFLETTAEIAVAFAGFVSVFIVLATRDGRFSPQEAFSIKTIVASSVAVVIYAAIPLLLHSLGLSEPVVWRASSGLAISIGVMIIAVLVPKWRAIPREDWLPNTGYQFVLDFVLGTVFCFGLIVNVLAWPWAPSGGIYLLAIWANLATAGLTFVALIFHRVLEV